MLDAKEESETVKDLRILPPSLHPTGPDPGAGGAIAGTYLPKYLAPVVVEEAGEHTLVAIRWGVWPFYAKDKPQDQWSGMFFSVRQAMDCPSDIG